MAAPPGWRGGSARAKLPRMRRLKSWIERALRSAGAGDAAPATAWVPVDEPPLEPATDEAAGRTLWEAHQPTPRRTAAIQGTAVLLAALLVLAALAVHSTGDGQSNDANAHAARSTSPAEDIPKSEISRAHLLRSAGAVVTHSPDPAAASGQQAQAAQEGSDAADVDASGKSRVVARRTPRAVAPRDPPEPVAVTGHGTDEIVAPLAQQTGDVATQHQAPVEDSSARTASANATVTSGPPDTEQTPAPSSPPADANPGRSGGDDRTRRQPPRGPRPSSSEADDQRSDAEPAPITIVIGRDAPGRPQTTP